MTQHTIKRLGLHGDGVADGPVYAARTLPGEVVTGALDGTALTDIRIETPSDARIAAPCRHYKSCGGCQLQHASDAFVEEWKAQVVVQALAAQGLQSTVRATLTSPPASRRRATFSARRTKKGATAGFHGRASDVITEVPECRVIDPGLLPALDAAKALAVIGSSRKAELAVTATLTEEGLDLAVTGGKPLDGPLRVELAQACGDLNLCRLTWEGEVIAARGLAIQRFDGMAVVPPPGAFLQATAHGEETLQGLVVSLCQDARRVVDLFCGCGTFALPLARHVEVHAVEADTDMIATLDRAHRDATGLKPVTAEARDLFRRPLLPDELPAFDVVVLDPPRAGAADQVEEIANSTVQRVVYVSCSPATFARDAARLVAAGFALEWVQPVDQFRWSSHVELVASLQRP